LKKQKSDSTPDRFSLPNPDKPAQPQARAGTKKAKRFTPLDKIKFIR
jgi:hypothetical protein